MAREELLGSVIGPQGIQGETGPTGPPGTAGVKGADGATWLSGSAAPTAAQGKDGDYYINSATWDVYKKTAGAWNKTGNIKGGAGAKGDKGDRGDAFSIAKVYTSIAAMNAGYPTDGVKQGQFVIIDTGDVNEEDNAKLYIKGASSYSYITDLSGASGMTGPQGPKGDAGARGATGATGAAGKNGLTPSFVIRDGKLYAVWPE